MPAHPVPHRFCQTLSTAAVDGTVTVMARGRNPNKRSTDTQEEAREVVQVTFLYIPAAISSVCCKSCKGNHPVAAGSRFIADAATAESLELTTENVEAVLDEVLLIAWQDPERDNTEPHCLHSLLSVNNVLLADTALPYFRRWQCRAFRNRWPCSLSQTARSVWLLSKQHDNHDHGYSKKTHGKDTSMCLSYMSSTHWILSILCRAYTLYTPIALSSCWSYCLLVNEHTIKNVILPMVTPFQQHKASHPVQ